MAHDREFRYRSTRSPIHHLTNSRNVTINNAFVRPFTHTLSNGPSADVVLYNMIQQRYISNNNNNIIRRRSMIASAVWPKIGSCLRPPPPIQTRVIGWLVGGRARGVVKNTWFRKTHQNAIIVIVLSLLRWTRRVTCRIEFITSHVTFSNIYNIGIIRI